jgi:hypothetical protein
MGVGGPSAFEWGGEAGGGRRLLQLSFLGALGKENMESAHSKGIESSHFEER